jgi:hypothetical protein
VFVLTGIKLLKDDIISLFLQLNPTNRGKKHKIRILCTHYKKLRDGVKKLKKDNQKALPYETGMVGPGRQDQEEHRCSFSWLFNNKVEGLKSELASTVEAQATHES